MTKKQKREAKRNIALIKEETARLLEIHRALLDDEFSAVPISLKMKLKKIADKINDCL